jgi:DNA-binding transcriptional LysR family regulator
MTAAAADWNEWFRANHMAVPPSSEGWLRVDSVQMAFEASIRGLGVALGRWPMIEPDIASGRLVPLGSHAVPSGSGYWLVTPDSEFEKPEVGIFRQWLISELGLPSETRKPRK